MGAVGATPLDKFRRRSGENALASLAVDACPGAGEEGYVELPCPLFVRVLEADPFVSIGGYLRSNWGHTLMMAGMSEVRDDRRPILTVTVAARASVLDARAGEADAPSLALWLEITGTSDDAYSYDIYFRSPADAEVGDVVQHNDDLAVVVPKGSIDGLQGAVLDFVIDEEGEGGLVVVNPNTPADSARSGLAPPATVDLSDPIARQVVLVLEKQVNPSIAVHGGRADLVAVEDLAVYLRLSGGCQGCGMAKATLSQGIEVMLREAIPELTAVVDVTDHASGANPFYEPAPI